MSFDNFKAQRNWLDVSLNQGHDVLAQLSAAGFPGVLFAEDISASYSFFVPETTKQDNGSANADVNWVDTSRNLADLGMPVTEPIYLWVWIEKKQDFYMVGMIVRELSFGRPILTTIE